MDHQYQKVCILQTEWYRVLHGEGVYVGYAQGEHYDADITVTYLKSCQGKIKIEGNQYDMSDGDMVIMNANEMHCSEIKDRTYHDRISICIDTSALRLSLKGADDLLGCFFNRGRGCYNVFPQKTVRAYGMDKLAEDILALAGETKNQDHILCSCRVIELLIKLNDAFLCLHDFQNEKNEKSEENLLISNVIELINGSFADIIDCEQIAARFFVNKFYLEHLFREQVGISLWNYVILKRLLYAKSLLKRGYSSQNAATLSGFSNYSNFFRLYKKHMGTTPTQSKKKN